MRIAIVSDIHGNLTALRAILEDLRETAPDLILHGGDLAHGGARPAEVADLIAGLGWPGVAGNADELMYRPESIAEFAGESSPALQPLWQAIEEQAAATRELLGTHRIAWLRELPHRQVHGSLALVHASPESLWRAPGPESTDAELESIYGPLRSSVAVYAHIHWPCVRRIGGMTVANTGSVSLSCDGDRRASYLLVDNAVAVIRRVDYDIEKELKALAKCGIPRADWVARSLAAARPQMP